MISYGTNSRATISVTAATISDFVTAAPLSPFEMMLGYVGADRISPIVRANFGR